MKLQYTFLITALLCSLSALAQTDKLVDPRDGKEYKVVQIGSQVWMAENLKYADTIMNLFVPGNRVSKDLIGHHNNYETPPYSGAYTIYCYDDDTSLCSKFGMLYTWKAAETACPIGWHLPGEEEYKRLFQTVAGGDMEQARKAIVRGGSSGFEARACGSLMENYNGNFNHSRYGGWGSITHFWTCTGNHGIRKGALLEIQQTSMNIFKDVEFECYIRCVKDSVPLFVDPRDGRQYKIQQIGSQVWMAENLAYAPSIISSNDVINKNTQNIFCYEDDTTNCKKYGALYSWTTAQNVCPVGWRLPKEEEFQMLLTTVGYDGKSAYQTIMKSERSLNFKEQISGFLISSGKYDGIGKLAGFWSSTTQDKKKAKAFIINSVVREAYVSSLNKESAYSVRCIKDTIQ